MAPAKKSASKPAATAKKKLAPKDAEQVKGGVTGFRYKPQTK